jgi:hypothetical protein
VTTTTTAVPQARPSACAVLPAEVARKGAGWSDRITLPASGRFVLESHLATSADRFGAGDFPATVTDRIDDHLQRSCALLRGLALARPPLPDCTDVYTRRHHREFTPAEGGGTAGQGSVGSRKPSVEEEAWIFNVMFARGSVPPPGQRWLLSANERSVVVVGGYEIGPAEQRFLGGVQGEVHWYLQTDNDDTLTLHGPLRDQSVPPGPVACE